MKLPEELEFDRLSDDEKYRRAVPGYQRRLFDLYTAIHRRFGSDGLELIREVSMAYGTRIGLNAQKKGPIKGVTAVGKYLLKVFDMVSDDCEVVEFSQERLVIRVHRCPFPFENDELCQAHTSMEQSLVATLDDRLEHRIGRSIPRGDRCCEHILCVKSSAA